MIVYYLFFIFFSIISIIEKSISKKLLLFLYVITSIIMIFFAGLRAEGVARDYKFYVIVFEQVGSFADYIIDYKNWSFWEPLFYYLVSFIKFFFDQYILFSFLTFAIISGAIKLFLIPKFSNYVFLTLLLYYVTYFSIHEMTQIRVGISSAFFLLGIYYNFNKDYKKTIICATISIGFHYSALLLFPVYFLSGRTINTRRYVFAILVSFLFLFIKIDAFQAVIDLGIPAISSKLSTYKNASIISFSRINIKVNLFGIVFISRLFLCLVILLFYNKIYTDGNSIFLKMYCISIISLIVLSTDTSGIAFRISELYGISEIFVLPLLVRLFKRRIIGYTIIILYCAAHLYNGLYVEKYLKVYRINSSIHF